MLTATINTRFSITGPENEVRAWMRYYAALGYASVAQRV